MKERKSQARWRTVRNGNLIKLKIYNEKWRRDRHIFIYLPLKLNINESPNEKVGVLLYDVSFYLLLVNNTCVSGELIKAYYTTNAQVHAH